MSDTEDTSTENVFGLTPETAEEEAPEVEAEPVEETPEVEEAPEVEDSQSESDDSESESAAEETEAEPEAQEEAPEEPKLYAKRYKSVEDLEEGYSHVQRSWTRAQQELRETQAREAQYRAALEKAAPLLQRIQQEQQEEGFEQPPVDVAKEVEQQVNARVNQMAQAQQAAQAQSAIQSFRQQHPEVEPGSSADQDLERIIREMWRDESGREDPARFPVTPENLNYAYELASSPMKLAVYEEFDLDPTDPSWLPVAQEIIDNPKLRPIIKAVPSLIESDEGMAYARAQAGVTPQPHIRSTERARQKAHVETGGSGEPVSSAPGETDDVWSDIKSAYNGQHKSVFGV